VETVRGGAVEEDILTLALPLSFCLLAGMK
jgi:hypothetical protein